jgi:hypothetical protein
LLGADGNSKPATRPKDCQTDRETTLFSGAPQCQTKLRPTAIKRQALWIRTVGDIGVGLGSERAGAPYGTALVGFDPETCAIRWESPLAFTTDPRHENPQLETELTRERIYGFYQLKSGRWLLGARDTRTGKLLWSRQPPRAEHGSGTISLTATDRRVYLALDWRLEVFEAKTGESLGVLW